MKALSLWQPWASLVALGIKRFETRGWSTPHRGPLAIHAARKLAIPVERDSSFDAALALVPPGYDWPLGGVVGVANLVDCVPTSTARASLSAIEIACGDYGPRRFAWKLEGARVVGPFSCRGELGIFDVDDRFATAKPGDSWPARRTHRCHAVDCDAPVPPEKLMCIRHWRMVPKAIKADVWKHYRPGQCDDKRTSPEWRDAARRAIAAVLIAEQRACERIADARAARQPSLFDGDGAAR